MKPLLELVTKLRVLLEVKQLGTGILGKYSFIPESYRWEINEFKNTWDTIRMQEESCALGNNTTKKEENDTRDKKSTLERPFSLFIYFSLTWKRLRYRQLHRLRISDFIFIASK